MRSTDYEAPVYHDGRLWLVQFNPPIVLESSCFSQQSAQVSDTTLGSHLVRLKDTVDLAKQSGVVYRIRASAVNLHHEHRETYPERSKGQDRNIELARS